MSTGQAVAATTTHWGNIKPGELLKNLQTQRETAIEEQRNSIASAKELLKNLEGWVSAWKEENLSKDDFMARIALITKAQDEKKEAEKTLNKIIQIEQQFLTDSNPPAPSPEAVAMLQTCANFGFIDTSLWEKGNSTVQEYRKKAEENKEKATQLLEKIKITYYQAKAALETPARNLGYGNVVISWMRSSINAFGAGVSGAHAVDAARAEYLSKQPKSA